MFPRLRRTVRRFGRNLRPVAAVLLVLAQGVAAFGAGVVVRGDRMVRPCGCKVNGPLAACCCHAGGCCAAPVEPIQEEEVAACPKCRAKQAAAPSAQAAVQSQPCRGESEIVLTADTPAVPPPLPTRPAFSPNRSGLLPAVDLFATSRFQLPPEPPPRRG